MNRKSLILQGGSAAANLYKGNGWDGESVTSLTANLPADAADACKLDIQRGLEKLVETR